MIRPIRAAALLAAIAGCWAGSCTGAAADDYTAISNSALDITGDIAFDDDGITFANGKTLRFADLIADHFVVTGDDVPASVYSVASPSDPVLLNGNKLCGSGPVTYVASWGQDDNELAAVVAVFTGKKAPEDDETACAVYLYEMKQ